MPQPPLVSVICLCYNHARFLRTALDSVAAQAYPNLEVLIVDDCSTDSSVSIIQEYLQRYPQWRFISTGHNIGNTRAFNMGWRASKGAFILDFATDDVLLPERIMQQVQLFAQLGATYGVVYSDAAYISDEGKFLYLHSQKYRPAPDGDVFAQVLQRYFICPPTMLMRRQVFEDLDGYDELLAYEDFDFWLRSSRTYKYAYLPLVTTQRRLHTQSLSASWYGNNKLLASTVKVCRKAANLVQTPEERSALAARLRYEARHAYLTGNRQETAELLELLQRTTGKMPLAYAAIGWLNKYKIELGFLRRVYYRWRYER